MSDILLAAIVFSAVAVLILLFTVLVRRFVGDDQIERFDMGEAAARDYGRRGEAAALRLVRGVLREDDALFSNIAVEFEGQRTELDCVVANRFGVFIIEVKNYSGQLVGGENDRFWRKYHTSRGGNVYEKSIRNPIGQVKRQTLILANALRRRGASVWVEGYVLLLRQMISTKNPRLLHSAADIECAIHPYGKSPLPAAKVNAVRAALRARCGKT